MIRNIILFLFISFTIISCSTRTERNDFNSSVSKEDSLKVYTLIDSANLYRIAGNLESAKTKIELAQKHSKKLNWGLGLAEAHTNLAYINLYESDFESAMANSVEGLRIAEKCLDKKNQGFANLLIGFIYLNLGDTSQVLPYYHKSINIREELEDNYDLGYSYSYIGNYYYTTQDFDSALYYHNIALEHRLLTEDIRSIADSYLLIGATHLKKKQFEKAQEQFQLALLKYAEIGDKKRLAETYRNFAEVYLSQGNNVDAENFLLQANILAKETGSIDNQILISDHLADIKYQDEKYQEAYDYLHLHIDMYQENSGESEYRAIVKNILKYKNDKEKKIKALEYQQNEEKQRLIVIWISILLAIFALFLIFIFSRLKHTKKQKEIIAIKKDEVDKAFSLLGVKNKEILDSINYAKRIQSAILPSKTLIDESFSQSFIIYLPKDIVAGDFYWLEKLNNSVLFAVADCTGHGVPGAMVSVICNGGLNRSVREYGLTDPGEILDQTRQIVISEFEKSEEEVKDGMDIALCSLENNILKYAGAHNPLWMIKKGESEVIEIKADKQPIGKFSNIASFTTHTLELEKGDTIYIFSDGFADQFGGIKGKKFKSNKLKELLISIQDKTIVEQKKILGDTFENWKGDLEQLDDVCVMCVRV
ncbi:MAG: serine phosphatase RsbU (regulator of sigma subunit) [Flavobacteriales bacterium]|jgi:serine phosphatase RsbU (regulator of sigma subunit)